MSEQFPKKIKDILNIRVNRSISMTPEKLPNNKILNERKSQIDKIMRFSVIQTKDRKLLSGQNQYNSSFVHGGGKPLKSPFFKDIPKLDLKR